MKPSQSIAALTLLAALTLPAMPAVAAIPPPTYSQPASTFSAGGGESTSTNYINLGVIGQPGIVGSSTGTSYSVNHGFLHVLGDGFKILYPVITVDKGNIAFTLVSNTSGSDTLAISNAGGSTLNWSIAKAQGSSWLTTTPASGSGDLSVNISANATGLAVSSTPYTDTLTISGAGIDQTVQVLLSLTVKAPATYRLTVTVVSDHATKGGGIVAGGSGTITCSNTGNNPATHSGSCTADLAPGTSITLSQFPDTNSTVATWSGARNGTGDCGVNNISANTDVTATFPYAYMVKIDSGNRYDTLAEALTNAASTDTIKARAVTFDEGPITFSSGKNISLYGGFDNYYATASGYSLIKGGLKVGMAGSRLNIKGEVKILP